MIALLVPKLQLRHAYPRSSATLSQNRQRECWSFQDIGSQAEACEQVKIEKSDMQTATVIGNATSTVKHASLEGWKLLTLQPLKRDGSPDGFPFLAIDNLGAGKGATVFFTSDGKYIRSMVGRNDCPIRYAVQGLLE